MNTFPMIALSESGNEVVSFTLSDGVVSIDDERFKYYIGNGIILNSKFEPIIIPYYNISINGRVNGIVFKISSSVLTNKSGLVEKFIIKHLLPWIEYTKYAQSPGLSHIKVPLSIEITSNFKDYITIPNVTKGNPTTDINKFLKENKQALISQIWAQ